MTDDRRVDDHVDIINLEGRYAKSWDEADGSGWADLFTPDGVFEVAAVGNREPFVVRGREALAAFCVDFNRTFTGVHLPSLPYVELSGDEATGRVNFHFVGVGHRSSAHSTTRTATGHYVVRYRRTDEGWLIAHRLEHQLVAARDDLFGQ